VDLLKKKDKKSIERTHAFLFNTMSHNCDSFLLEHNVFVKHECQKSK